MLERLATAPGRRLPSGHHHQRTPGAMQKFPRACERVKVSARL
jgi:hypothetical protein